MDQERRRGVGAAAELGHGRDGGDARGGRGRGPGTTIGGPDGVEEEGQAVAFFEEGEDELGARVAGAHPAQVAAVGGGGGCGVGCYLSREKGDRC